MQQADKTVKGAADKILGLLNPQPEAQAEPKQDEGQSTPEVKQAEPSVEWLDWLASLPAEIDGWEIDHANHVARLHGSTDGQSRTWEVRLALYGGESPERLAELLWQSVMGA